MPSSVGIAILGGGIFISDAHIPGLAQNKSLIDLKGIWSRSTKSAEKAAQAAATNGFTAVDVYSEDRSANLDQLLARPDVEAVIIALPIVSQSAVIRRALEAGKHVLSEKPLGADVAKARELVEEYEQKYKPKGQVWRVAENWEVEPAHLFAREVIRQGKIGEVKSFALSTRFFVDSEGENKYFETEWRKSPGFQGGYLLDAGVHNAAGLRAILPEPMTHLTGYTALNNDHLAPLDYLSAVVRCGDGARGQVLIDYGALPCDYSWRLDIIGSIGRISSQDRVVDDVDSIEVEVVVGKPVKGQDKELKVFAKNGVAEEQKRFFEAIGGSDDGFGDPRGGLSDVAFLEAALNSHGQERTLF